MPEPRRVSSISVQRPRRKLAKADPPPAGDVALDTFFHGAVIGLDGTKVRLRYDFSTPDQRKDWVDGVSWNVPKDPLPETSHAYATIGLVRSEDVDTSANRSPTRGEVGNHRKEATGG